MTQSDGPKRGGPHQTRSYLQEMLTAHGLRPRRQLGQNFLIDLNLLDILVQAADVQPGAVVLEVGSGTGALTSRLSDLAERVVSVEIDPGFHALACKETAGRENVEILHLDALANKNRMHPEVMERVGAALRAAEADRYHLVANLPYDVATSVIGNLLLEDLPLGSMTFTVQLEMGQRISAAPASKDYGPISVLANTLGTVTWIRSLPPSAFWPRPKINSAILRIDIAEGMLGRGPRFREFHRFVRDLFIHRRKNLRGAVASIPGCKQFKKQLDILFPKLGLAAENRAEQLEPAKLLELFDGLQSLAQKAKEPSDARVD